MKTVLTIVIMSLALVTPAAAQVEAHIVTLGASREAIVATPHKNNNDGSWGFGWVRLTTRSLIGFDVSGLAGRGADINSAIIKLYVSDNDFTMAGNRYFAHPNSASDGAGDWKEGHNLFNLFSYCQKWSVPATSPAFAPPGDTVGVTWNCAADPNYVSPSVNCATSWAPSPQTDVHPAFAVVDVSPTGTRWPNENTFFGQKDECDHPVTDGNTCAPSCSASIECFAKGTAGKSVDECWRTVLIDVTQDIQDALNASPADLKPSWEIKRETESGSGGFHYFSREGARCILGGTSDPDSDPSYKALEPVLVLNVSGTMPTVTQPADHCVAY